MQKQLEPGKPGNEATADVHTYKINDDVMMTAAIAVIIFHFTSSIDTIES